MVLLDDRGKFCDEEMTMCDGTNAFWCEHGGKCEEIIQGEKYECKCLPGYSGERCEHSGRPCGQNFCFHDAECLSPGDVCDCPPVWKGSADCFLPTQPQTGQSFYYLSLIICSLQLENLCFPDLSGSGRKII